MSKTQIRAILRNAFGPRGYRITREGEIHIYGQMPNTDQVGWYFFGHLDSAETLARIAELE